jgi:hypothetical protein
MRNKRNMRTKLIINHLAADPPPGNLRNKGRRLFHRRAFFAVGSRLVCKLSPYYSISFAFFAYFAYSSSKTGRTEVTRVPPCVPLWKPEWGTQEGGRTSSAGTGNAQCI